MRTVSKLRASNQVQRVEDKVGPSLWECPESRAKSGEGVWVSGRKSMAFILFSEGDMIQKRVKNFYIIKTSHRHHVI